MYSADEWDDFERTGTKPTKELAWPRADRDRRSRRTPRSRLTVLAVVMALAAVTGLTVAHSAGSVHWYNYASAALSVAAAALYWAVARLSRLSVLLIGLAIAAAVVRVLFTAGVFTFISASWTAGVVYGLVLPAGVAVYAIVVIVQIARGPAASPSTEPAERSATERSEA